MIISSERLPAPASRSRDSGAAPAPRRYRVLLAVDGSAGSRAAARFVVQLAKSAPDMEVVLTNVQPPSDGPGDEAELECQGRDDTLAARALLERAQIRHALCLLRGDPVAAVVASATAWDCAEIVVGSRPGSGRAEPAAARGATRFVHAARVPVTVVKADNRTDRSPRNCLVACDGSRHALRALRHAIGQHLPAPACPPVEVLFCHGGEAGHPAPLARTEQSLERNGVAGRSLVAQACAGAMALFEESGLDYALHVRRADPAEAILATVDQLRSGRIVMGVRRAAPFRDLIGSVSRRVLQDADVPVTLVR
jgi:nucleotide-binding universal stress UspA family protein